MIFFRDQYRQIDLKKVSFEYFAILCTMFTSLTLFRILFFFLRLYFVWSIPEPRLFVNESRHLFLVPCSISKSTVSLFFCLLSDNRIFFYFARLFVACLLICGIIVFSMNNFFLFGLPSHRWHYQSIEVSSYLSHYYCHAHLGYCLNYHFRCLNSFFPFPLLLKVSIV